MCFYLQHSRRVKEWRRGKRARRGGANERETTQRERDTSGGTTWDTHGHTHASGKNTLTQFKNCSRYTPNNDTHTHSATVTKPAKQFGLSFSLSSPHTHTHTRSKVSHFGSEVYSIMFPLRPVRFCIVCLMTPSRPPSMRSASHISYPTGTCCSDM